MNINMNMDYALLNQEKENMKKGVKREDKEEREKREERIYKATKFLLFLIGILGVLYILKISIKRKHFNIPVSFHPFLSFVYIIFYAIVSGLLIYFGSSSLNGFLEIYMDNWALVDLISTSIVVIFSMIYSAYIEKILVSITGIKINISLYKNVLGYALARSVLVTALYFAK